ncbi:MAG: MFS transporter [Boseongicola sp.]|nr:MFS transporter [Boseongicola sp.]
MVKNRRIWGWFFFDWASQPYHTVLLTFIFGPYFVSVAQGAFESGGANPDVAKSNAQGMWSFGLTLTGLLIGLSAPFLGALADTARRRMPWIAAFSLMFVMGATGLWWAMPDGSNLWWALISFGFGFIGAEFALIFTNAQLPGLGSRQDIGRISGSGFAFGYLGGLIALILVLVLLVEQPNGKTIAGLTPLFGLDAEGREGTRFAGPFTAIWFAVFMIPYFLWVRESAGTRERASFGAARDSLVRAVRGLAKRPSLTAFLGGSMLYRDALNALYGFGGTYATLVLGWSTTRVGIFGIVSVIAAAGLSYVGGLLDRKFGPKPVIAASILGLVGVCGLILSMTPTSIAGIALSAGSDLPDTMFFACGVLIGGLGGIVQAASRSLMVRHTDLETPTESFGLYGLSGRATAFLAPMLIGVITVATNDVRLGVSPLIVLFLLGLVLLFWVKPDGDRAGP